MGGVAIEKFDIFSKCFAGASVFDPTIGKETLLESLPVRNFLVMN
jgi:hypothetical protein